MLTRGGILRSVNWFFVFYSNTKRLVMKNKEPCTKWITLKILSLVHFRRGNESLFNGVCMCIDRGVKHSSISIVCVYVVAQESQASALRCLQDSLKKHNTTLTVTYSATLHDREIRFVNFAFWSCTSSDYCTFCVIVCASVLVHWCVVSVSNLEVL